MTALGPPVGVVRAVVRDTEEPPGRDGRHPSEPRLLQTRVEIRFFFM